MQCFDAFRDAHGNPGEHKEPVPGYPPMSKEEALAALQELKQQRPGEDFWIRRLAEVEPIRRAAMIPSAA